jgi:hypothetical protein
MDGLVCDSSQSTENEPATPPRRMMAALEEEEIEHDPPERRSVDVAAGYNTTPPTP